MLLPDRGQVTAPAFAAQTDEILQELGLDWDRILALKAAGRRYSFALI